MGSGSIVYTVSSVIPHKARSAADAGPNTIGRALLKGPASSAFASCGMTGSEVNHA